VCTAVGHGVAAGFHAVNIQHHSGPSKCCKALCQVQHYVWFGELSLKALEWVLNRGPSICVEYKLIRILAEFGCAVINQKDDMEKRFQKI
jgi:hypothetical protein